MGKALYINYSKQIAALFLLGAFLFHSISAQEITYYISNEGNDSWSGQISASNETKTDGPFRTFDKVKTELAQINKDITTQVTVRVKAYDYYLNTPITISSTETGVNKNCKFLFEPYPDEIVTISTGVKLKNAVKTTNPDVLSKLGASAQGKVWQYDLNTQGLKQLLKVATTGPQMMLLYDKQMMQLARFPSKDWVTIVSAGKSFTSGKPVTGLGVITYTIPANQGDLKADENAFLFGYWGNDYSGEHQLIGVWEASSKQLEIMPPAHKYGYETGQRFCFYNVLEELDEPGEWYADIKTGIIYFWPLAEDFENQMSLIGTGTSAIVLNSAQNVTFKGFTINGCGGPAISINEGVNNCLDNLIITNCIANAIQIRGGKNNNVSNCEINNIGAGAIWLGGGNRQTLTAGNNIVENCHVHHFAMIQRSYQPAIYFEGVGNVARNNCIHDAPHQGIFVTGNDHLIEKNELYNLALETGDVGAIYSGRDWTFRGNVIRYNYIHDINGPGKYGSVGVYMDDLCSGFGIYSNVFDNCYTGILIGGGRDHIVKNNIFIRCPGSAIKIDDRGLNKNQKSASQGGGWKMYEKLQAVKYNQPPYSTKYPELANITSNNPLAPSGNQITNNVFYDTKLYVFKPDDQTYWQKTVKFDKNTTLQKSAGLTNTEDIVEFINSNSSALSNFFSPIDLTKIGNQE